MKFRREHRLKLISFLIATTLWYFVVWGKPVERVLEVPVIYHPVNPDYIVETNPSTVIVKIIATRSTLRSFSRINLKIDLDLSKYSQGVYQLRIPVEKLKLPGQIKIKDINPGFVTVIIRKLVRKRVPVVVAWDNSEPFDYKTLSKKVKVVPQTVIIKGTWEVVTEIKKIYTSAVKFSELKEKKKVKVPLIPPFGVQKVKPDKVLLILK